MAQYGMGSGKAVPPWQQRGNAGLPSSLLGQHPQTPQYAPVQQSMIQPPGQPEGNLQREQGAISRHPLGFEIGLKISYPT